MGGKGQATARRELCTPQPGGLDGWPGAQLARWGSSAGG